MTLVAIGGPGARAKRAVNPDHIVRIAPYRPAWWLRMWWTRRWPWPDNSEPIGSVIYMTKGSPIHTSLDPHECAERLIHPTRK